MRRNNVAINNILKKKNYKTIFSISSILKKIDKYNFKNKKIKQKNYVEKHCSNPQYFKEKNYKAKILTKSIFKK